VKSGSWAEGEPHSRARHLASRTLTTMAVVSYPRAAGPVLMVASNATHAQTFLPVAPALERYGATVAFLTLDRFYSGGAESTLASARREWVPLRAPQLAPGFYRQGTMAVWKTVARARASIRDALADTAPAVVVVGNDSGLLEKVVLREASRKGARTVLVQDGRLASSTPRAPGVRAGLRAIVKNAASPVLRCIGLEYLAASQYGEGGVDLLCASGPHGAALLKSRAPRTRVVICGQPRYDRLHRIAAAQASATTWHVESNPALSVAYFTTPFGADGLGDESQLAQERLVLDLARVLASGRDRLLVKPHPRDKTHAYASVLPPDALRESDDPADLLARVDVAILGISSLIEEAGLLGCPVVVPGSFMHFGNVAMRLPDPTVYPRFEGLREALTLLDALRSRNARGTLAARQEARVREEVLFDAAHPAAEAVAQAILGA
jgi:hypothetical protein